ncbi:hypothetical protein GCM10028824_09700 [Hymenobacter segetis]|uniref:SusE domain-containing protein n=1 Tax=Hymenobacter segetis TaxID=2025509 RepID=A0ABU9LT52_9BACT
MTKNLFTTALLAGLLAVSFTSCKKDEIRTTATFSDAPKLSSNTTNAGVLLRANKDNDAVTYTWTPYTYTLSDNTTSTSPVIYTLQISADGAFANPYELVAGTDKAASLKLTVGQLNAALINLKAPLTKASTLQVRLKTFVANNESAIYSNAVSISATPYDECVAPNSDTWSLIGLAGVDWSTDVPLKWSCSENAYVVTMALNADEFKFRRNNDWAVNLGGAGSGVTTLTVGGTTALATGNPPNLKIGTAGTYTIKLKVTGSGATTAGTVTLVK